MATISTTALEQPLTKAPIDRAPSPRPRLHATNKGDLENEGIELSPIGDDASSSQSQGVSASAPFTQTPSQSALERVQFASLCWTLFLAGWNDGTTGPLLPRVQESYHVGFALVSMVFVANCIGFILAAMVNVYLTHRIGFGKTIVLGSFLQCVGYAIEAPAPPFPAFCIGYFVNGIGIGLQDAQANGYVASLKKNAATKMGVLHAVYGLGATASPIVATQFAQLPGRAWSYHFLAGLGIALINTFALIAVFRFKRQDDCLAQIGQSQSAGDNDGSQDTGSANAYRQMLRLRSLHLLAFFILVYVGVEVTIGGWIVTYVINVRGGGPSSGYISSGFFGGLTLGRVALLWVNHKVGERRVLFIYAFLAIGLELVVWLVPSLIGGAVAVSLVGVLLGPFYPIAMNHAGRVLPRWLLTGCIGWIASFGQAGSALLPFATGAIASKAGIKVLQPVLVSMMAVMICLWALVPRSTRRTE